MVENSVPDRLYQAYYTKSDPIVNYMTTQLDVQKGDYILEPCGGDGVFIDSVLKMNDSNMIDVYELNTDSVVFLKEKYQTYNNIKILNRDTLLDKELMNFFDCGRYDKIIANPPYGAWQEYDKRDKLKKIFPDLYVKETSTLFLYRCIELLKQSGRLVFILPDTFLSVHLQKNLRKYLLTHTIVKEILLFPSSFFPGVNFGYANLCIITLEKELDINKIKNNEIRIINNFNKVQQLENLNDDSLHVMNVKQSQILENPDYSFLINKNSSISNLIANHKLNLKDVADCVTGFYSGNDKKFLKVISKDIRNAKKYDLVDSERICWNPNDNYDIISGINGHQSFVPIVKGGNVKYVKKDNWFMDWAKDTVRFYKKDKKARFQNSQYYFKYGIGVPMVSSSSITGCLIENKLFDQSIVGIFPHDINNLYYILALVNSPTCNQLIRTINPSANNPSNYIKKIPFVLPDKMSLELINRITKKIINDIKNSNNYDRVDELKLHVTIQEIYNL